jgi:uridine kinase
MAGLESHVTVQKRAYYSPPWADVSIIGVAGSSGSGKSTLSQAIVKKLNLPWVVILSMVRFFHIKMTRIRLITRTGLVLQVSHSRAI